MTILHLWNDTLFPFRLIQVGEDFCPQNPDNLLQDSLKAQCLTYFQNYHNSRLEELKMHLENEGFAKCPVKSTFKVMKLVEFRHLKPTNTKLFSSPQKKVKNNEFLVSPFESNYTDNSYIEDEGLCNEEVYSEEESESDEDIDEELKRDFVDENTGEILNHETYSIYLVQSNLDFACLNFKSWI